jgi:hypothetical protein
MTRLFFQLLLAYCLLMDAGKLFAQDLPRDQAKRIEREIRELDLQYEKTRQNCVTQFRQNACETNAKEQHRASRIALVDAKQQWMGAQRNLDAEKTLIRTVATDAAVVDKSAAVQQRREALQNRINARAARRAAKLNRQSKP